MFPIGMLSEEEAQQFVAMYPLAKLGSRSADGRRRIVTEATEADRRLLELAFPASGQLQGQTDSQPGICTPCQQQAIGDRLAQIIKNHRPNETPCAGCRAEIERLNNMTPEQVLEEAQEIASRIVARAADGASSTLDRWVASALPSIPKAVVSRWIQEAVRTAGGTDAESVG